MKESDIIDWLKTTDVPLNKVSKKTGVSRKTLYNYINGSKPNVRKLKLIENQYSSEMIIKGEDTMMNTNYIIDLQKDKIQYQQNEIERLERALMNKEAESTHWDTLKYDFYVETKFYLQSAIFARKIKEVTNLERQSEMIGYSNDELKSLWDVGVKHKHNEDMPLNKILDKSTLKDINEKTRTFPAIFNTLKSMVGHHYIPMPTIYIHKNGSKVPAISYNKIKWSEMMVYSKIEYLKV